MEIGSKDILDRQHQAQLKRRAEYLIAQKAQDLSISSPQSIDHAEASLEPTNLSASIPATESTPSLVSTETEQKILIKEFDVVNLGKTVGDGLHNVETTEYHGANTGLAYADVAKTMTDSGYRPIFETRQVRKYKNIFSTNSDKFLQMQENKERHLHPPLFPAYAVTCLPTLVDGEMLLAIGHSLTFTEGVLNLKKQKDDNLGREAFQFNGYERIKQEDSNKYSYRGYNWVDTLHRNPLFYVNGPETVDTLSKQLEPFTLRSAWDNLHREGGTFREPLNFEFQPSFGGFAEQYVAGKLNDEDIILAANMLSGLYKGEVMAVDGYGNEQPTQLAQTIKQLYLTEFVLNIYGKWFMFATRPTASPPLVHIIPTVSFLDQQYKPEINKELSETEQKALARDLSGRKMSILDLKNTGQELKVQNIANVLREALMNLRSNNFSLTPINFYTTLEKDIKNNLEK